MKFQTLSIVRLRTAENAPPPSPQDEEIQAAHIEYLTGLREKGIILLNGPIRPKIDDPDFRGMSIYSVNPEEARKYALEDPAVKAGWFKPHVDGWLLPSIPTTLGDRVDLEL